MEILFTHERLDDFLLIEKMLVEHRLLIDAVDYESTHPCHLVNYSLLPSDEEVYCLLDRNIVSYLIQMIQGIELQEDYEKSKCYRLAAGLQAFLNAAHVFSEPGLSYHEYMEHAGIEATDKELSLFRSADNLNANIYLDLALMKRNKIESHEVPIFSSGELCAQDIPEKLKLFETNIVFIKKALSLQCDGHRDHEVMLKLLDWIYTDYIFSAPSFHFLSIYFSSRRISGMLKSKSMKGIRNAAWDLCFLQHWLKMVQSNPSQHWLMATMDEAMKETASLMLIRDSETSDCYLFRLKENYTQMWGKKTGRGNIVFKRFVEFLDNKNSPERKINNPKNRTEDYIIQLRRDVEMEFQAKVMA